MPTLCPGIDCVLATPLERGAGRESGGAGGEEEGQKEEARVRLSKYKPVESYIVSWRVLGMSTLQSMLHTTYSAHMQFNLQNPVRYYFLDVAVLFFHNLVSSKK